MASRRVTTTLLVLLTLLLAGTVIVLGSVWGYFHVDRQAMIHPEELLLISNLRADFAKTAWTSANANGHADSSGRQKQEQDGLLAPYSPISSWLPSWLLNSIPGDAGSDSEPSAPHTPTLAGSSAVQAAEPATITSAQENVTLAGLGDPSLSLHAYGSIPEGDFHAGQSFNSKATQGLSSMRLPPGPDEQIPRLIHQTWKSSVLPERWQAIRAECKDMHPDYDYVLWTDADSRAFIKKHYNWFLETFDSYPFPIQRADVIRYFVLYHYGGVYMDLDIGCLRPMDPLLAFELILPETIPVGVSNDLMMSVPQHPFMKKLIQQLPAFNHDYMLPYPTVMFSTGPMFVSASYSMWADANGIAMPSALRKPKRGLRGIRILAKSLYGKNLDMEIAKQQAFFKHFYGSSWHTNDAGFIILLRDVGKYLFLIGVGVIVYGIVRKVGLRPRGRLRGLRAVITKTQVKFAGSSIRSGNSSRSHSVSPTPFSSWSRNHSQDGLWGHSPSACAAVKEKEMLQHQLWLQGTKIGGEPFLLRPQPRKDLTIFLGNKGSSGNGDEFGLSGSGSGSEVSAYEFDDEQGAAQYLLRFGDTLDGSFQRLRRAIFHGGRTPSPTQSFHPDPESNPSLATAITANDEHELQDFPVSTTSPDRRLFRSFW